VTRRGCLAAVAAWVFAAGLAGAAAPPQPVGWGDLRAAAAAEDNPFARLSAEQCEALREIVIGRMGEARGVVPSDTERRRRFELVEQLRAHGIDVEAMLARRIELMAQRRSAAETGVAALKGRSVRLGGVMLPLQGAMGGEFLLVPSIGACSHAGAPLPNQAVRVRPARLVDPALAYGPVTVLGVMVLRAEQGAVYLVDGEMTVRSSYAIDGAELLPAPTMP
jgi:uncharacterized protein